MFHKNFAGDGIKQNFLLIGIKSFAEVTLIIEEANFFFRSLASIPGRYSMPPSILRRSKKIPFMDTSNNTFNKDESIVSYQQLGFSPSAFLNTSNSYNGETSKEMVTSTPAKGLVIFYFFVMLPCKRYVLNTVAAL